MRIPNRYFYQSAIDSSIRKASQNLNINSSAIVRQIQKLEDRLQTRIGGVLFQEIVKNILLRRSSV